jgi:hypothetical protein
MTVTTMRTRGEGGGGQAVDANIGAFELRQVGRGQRLAVVAGRDEMSVFLEALRNVPLP